MSRIALTSAGALPATVRAEASGKTHIAWLRQCPSPERRRPGSWGESVKPFGNDAATIGRREAIALVGAAGLVAVFPTRRAHPQARPLLIGFLCPQTKAAFATNIDQFQLGLKELEYTEGQNLTIEWRFTEGANDKLPAAAAELVKLEPKLIVTAAAGAVPASTATTTIPIVVGNFAVGTANLAQFIGPNIAKPSSSTARASCWPTLACVNSSTSQGS